VTRATLEDVVTVDPRPTSRPDQAVEVQELYATIARLPDDFRLALVAVDVLGLSYREASQALRVREATLTTRLFRARKQVAQRLGADGPPRPSDARKDRRALSGAEAPGAAGSPGRARASEGRREGTDASGVSVEEGIP